MLLSILVILIVLGIAYVHYLQGCFTAAISLACAIGATLVAFGYYETAVNAMQQNGFADFGGGASLMLLFAVAYAVLRVLADMLVPGNIALQLYVERVGAAVLGLGAGLLCAGVFATGLQMMPLGASIAGFSRYEVRDRAVVVPANILGRQRGDDSNTYDEVVGDKLENPASLLLPADEIASAVVRTASAGAFAGRQAFGDVHPDLPAETFYARVGSEHSGKHVVLNTAKQTNVTVEGLYEVGPSVTALDSEITDLRNNKQALTYKPSAAETLIVVRAKFADAAADKDGIVRLTPAAARLVVDGQSFFPVGTMEGATYLALNRIDDLIPVAGGVNRSADFVYALPKSAAAALAKATPDSATVAFVEFKLFGRVDLSGRKIEPFAGAPKTTRVVRKAASPLGIAAKISAAAPR